MLGPGILSFILSSLWRLKLFQDGPELNVLFVDSQRALYQRFHYARHGGWPNNYRGGILGALLITTGCCNIGNHQGQLEKS